jgi:hypothetical protein
MAKLKQKGIDFIIRALKEIPEKGEFNISTWGFHSSDHPPEEDNACGTVACVAGWIYLHPDAKEFGLRHRWLRSHLHFGAKGHTKPARQIARITGLPEHEIDDLFFPFSYRLRGVLGTIQPVHVIEQIERLRAKYSEA